MGRLAAGRRRRRRSSLASLSAAAAAAASLAAAGGAAAAWAARPLGHGSTAPLAGSTWRCWPAAAWTSTFLAIAHPHLPLPSRACGRHAGRCRAGLRAAAGDELGGLELEAVLGEGGFGTTWRARAVENVSLQDLVLEQGQVVAVKLLRLEEGWTSVDRFEREAAVLRRLNHPAIPAFYGTVVHDRPDGRDFGLVSELVRGPSLLALVREGRWAASAANVRCLAEALLSVCAQLATFAPPVVHRDVKPANVVLEPVEGPEAGGAGWRPFLVDFGAAVLGGGVRTTAVGTFGYMAPESFGQVFTPKSDLYGVGATLLFAVTGREPGSFPQERLKIQFRDALVGTVWEAEEAWLAELLEGLLAPAPEDRFASASEALAFLRPSGAGAPRAAGRGAGLAPPRGSAIRAARRGLELQLLLPPPSVLAALPTAGFATAWTSFVGFWTASVLSAGAPVMALFSLPFWGVGGTLLKDSLGPLLQGSMELRIGPQTWRVGRVGKEKAIMEGRTADLECFLETTAIVNGRELGCLVLQEGLERQLLGQGLQQAEQEWLAGAIQEHLERCRAAR